MAEEYPKEVKVKDGSAVVLRLFETQGRAVFTMRFDRFDAAPGS